MSVTSLLTKDYDNKSNPTLGENKPNSNPISSEAKISVIFFVTRNYENNPAPRLRQNKAKQTQFPRGQEMSASSIITKHYENQTLCRPPENKANQTQSQTCDYDYPVDPNQFYRPDTSCSSSERIDTNPRNYVDFHSFGQK